MAWSFTIASVTPIVMVGALLTPRAPTYSAPDANQPPATAGTAEGPSTSPGLALDESRAFDEEDEEIDENGADGALDQFGNEVADAVAKYKLDPAGSLYEVHSPRTELPRLGSPRS